MTIICKSRKFVFVHLAKCGGTSVELAFAPYARWGDLIVGSTYRGELLQPFYRWRYGIGKHSAARQIRRAVPPALWAECWTVALVRHPLRIYESLYGWAVGLAESYQKKYGLDRNEFAQLCRGERLRGRLARSWVMRAYAESSNFPEFVDVLFARGWMAETLTSRLSQNGSIIVDNVFKLEEIDRFWDEFEMRTGATLRRLHVNRSERRDCQWDERHIRQMHRRFHVDFVNFGYE